MPLSALFHNFSQLPCQVSPLHLLQILRGMLHVSSHPCPTFLALTTTTDQKGSTCDEDNWQEHPECFQDVIMLQQFGDEWPRVCPVSER